MQLAKMVKGGNTGKNREQWQKMAQMVKYGKYVKVVENAMRCNENDTLPKCGENGKNWKLYIIIVNCNYSP